MAKKKNTDVVRQTEYRSKKNSGKKKKAALEDVSKEKELDKPVEKEKDIFDENELSTEFVEKKSSGKNKVIKEEVNNVKEDKHMETKKGSRIFVNFFLCFVLLVGVGFFLLHLYLNKDELDIINVGSLLLIILFTLFFVPIGLKSRNKVVVFFASLLLGLYFTLGIYTSLNGSEATVKTGMKDFSNENLTEVVKWAEKNKITLKQEYEYSDMVDEYEIITQDVEAGTSLKKVKELTVVVSEGPNPSKEIIIPNMVSWDTERVIDFVNKNYLSNVSVEFVESDKAVDTVIEQSKAGNLKRDEELKITFSYGEELGYEEVKLIDFTNKTEFEVMFYMKQHHLNYEFDRDFSEKIKRNLAMKQDKKPGTSVKIYDEKVKVTFSKGKEIEVPDLMKMKVSEITEWIIENRLKLEFSDKYDEKVKANSVISANYKKGDKVEQGETIKIVISKGNLKMPKFNSYEEFREWADKYEIKYEEKHEFSSTVKIGEIISYSYKTGDVIKNDDVVIVTISDGEAVKVPALDGLTKSQAEEKLDKLGLKYSFVYKYSNSVKENAVISQSISAGSEISANTTITITISKGKNSGSSSSSSSSSSGSSSSSSGSSKEEEKHCVKMTDKIDRRLNNVLNEIGGSASFEKAKSIYQKFFEENYPGVKVNIVGEKETGMSTGSIVGCHDNSPSNCITFGSEVTSCNGVTYNFVISE